MDGIGEATKPPNVENSSLHRSYAHAQFSAHLSLKIHCMIAGLGRVGFALAPLPRSKSLTIQQRATARRLPGRGVFKRASSQITATSAADSTNNNRAPGNQQISLGQRCKIAFKSGIVAAPVGVVVTGVSGI